MMKIMALCLGCACLAIADSAANSKLDLKVQKYISESWNDVTVKTDKNKWMWVVTTHNQIKMEMFTSVLIPICLEIDENKGKLKFKLSRILVLNKHKAQGYVYETPSKCGELMRTPSGKELDLKIMSATHIYSASTEKEMIGE